MDALIKCHFTLEELKYLNEVMVREGVLAEHLNKQLSGLQLIGIRMTWLPKPNLAGKLLSYIKRGEENAKSKDTKSRD